VSTQSALHKPYRRRWTSILTPQPRRLGSLRGQNGGNYVSSRTCSASDLVSNWRAEIMASHWAAVESRKIQEKIDISENIAMMSGSSRPKPEVQPAPSSQDGPAM
jgi:hypothetical protein